MLVTEALCVHDSCICDSSNLTDMKISAKVRRIKFSTGKTEEVIIDTRGADGGKLHRQTAGKLVKMFPFLDTTDLTPYSFIYYLLLYYYFNYLHNIPPHPFKCEKMLKLQSH